MGDKTTTLDELRSLLDRRRAIGLDWFYGDERQRQWK